MLLPPSIGAPPAAFTKRYVSSNQAITGAGSLTLAHGLGVVPTQVAIELVCTTAENGYSIGDVLPVAAHGRMSNVADGAAITPDATNLNIRYGSNSPVFNGLHKTTGATCSFANANWVARFRAWA